jgi:hypothetical protein
MKTLAFNRKELSILIAGEKGPSAVKVGDTVLVFFYKRSFPAKVTKAPVQDKKNAYGCGKEAWLINFKALPRKGFDPSEAEAGGRGSAWWNEKKKRWDMCENG